MNSREIYKCIVFVINCFTYMLLMVYAILLKPHLRKITGAGDNIRNREHILTTVSYYFPLFSLFFSDILTMIIKGD